MTGLQIQPMKLKQRRCHEIWTCGGNTSDRYVTDTSWELAGWMARRLAPKAVGSNWTVNGQEYAVMDQEMNSERWK